VTFNYDKVPERLGLFAPVPQKIGFRSGVPVYKMHGSTDWNSVLPRRAARRRL
jgi:hypothetical protein